MRANRRHRARWIAVIALAAILPLANTARADELKARASRLFHQASDAYASGQFAAAASSFEESDRLVPRAAVIYDAALAWEAAGDAARAAEDYESSLGRSDLSADQVAIARGQLKALSLRVGALEVFAPAGAQIAVGAREGVGPRLRLYLEPGVHEVVVNSPGAAPERRTVDVAAGESKVARFEPPAPSPAPSVASPPAPQTRPETPAVAPATGSNAARTLAWITLGTSVAFAGAAAYLGVKTLDARSALITSGDTSRSAHDDAVRDRFWTNVCWVAAGAAGVIGATLLVWSLRSGKTANRVALQLELGRASLVAQGSF